MKKIICFLFGHRYRLLRNITETTREIYCKRCKQKFAMNDDAQVVLPMDEEFRKLHEFLLDKNFFITPN